MSLLIPSMTHEQIAALRWVNQNNVTLIGHDLIKDLGRTLNWLGSKGYVEGKIICNSSSPWLSVQFSITPDGRDVIGYPTT